jgi:hypothetical protein
MTFVAIDSHGGNRTPWIMRTMAVALLVCGLTGCRTNALPAIRFAPPDTDPRQVRRDLPLTATERAALTPANLQSLTQDQVNQIYARLSAGPLPDGAYRGDLFFPRGANGRARLRDMAGPLPSGLAHLATLRVERLARALWRGKVFYRAQAVVRNRIEDLAILKPLLRDDETIPKLSADGRTTWLLFPARVACGPSELDPPHRSVILDYSQGKSIEGYREVPDRIAGAEGLKIRDEIRLIRRGFYLGRVYFGDRFGLNFTLLQPEGGSTAAPVSETADCE